MKTKILIGAPVSLAALAVGANLYFSQHLETQAQKLVDMAQANLPEGTSLTTGAIEASAWQSKVSVQDVVFEGFEDGAGKIAAGDFTLMSSFSAIINKEGPEGIAFEDVSLESSTMSAQADTLSFRNQAILTAIVSDKIDDLKPEDITGDIELDGQNLMLKDSKGAAVAAEVMTFQGSIERGSYDLMNIEGLTFTNPDDNVAGSIQSARVENIQVGKFIADASEFAPDAFGDEGLQWLLDGWKAQDDPSGKSLMRFNDLKIKADDDVSVELGEAGYEFDYDTQVLSNVHMKEFAFSKLGEANISLEEMYLDRQELGFVFKMMKLIAEQGKRMQATFADMAEQGEDSDNAEGVQTILAEQARSEREMIEIIYSDETLDSLFNALGMNEFRMTNLVVEQEGVMRVSMDNLSLNDIVRDDGMAWGGTFRIDDFYAGPIPAVQADAIGLQEIRMDFVSKQDLKAGDIVSDTQLILANGVDLGLSSSMEKPDADEFKAAYKELLIKSTSLEERIEGNENPMEVIGEMISLYADLPINDVQLTMSLVDLGIIGYHMERQSSQMNLTRDELAQTIGMQGALFLPMQFEPDEVAVLKAEVEGLLMSNSSPLGIKMTLQEGWRDRIKAMVTAGSYDQFKVGDFIDVFSTTEKTERE